MQPCSLGRRHPIAACSWRRHARFLTRFGRFSRVLDGPVAQGNEASKPPAPAAVPAVGPGGVAAAQGARVQKGGLAEVEVPYTNFSVSRTPGGPGGVGVPGAAPAAAAAAPTGAAGGDTVRLPPTAASRPMAPRLRHALAARRAALGPSQGIVVVNAHPSSAFDSLEPELEALRKIPPVSTEPNWVSGNGAPRSSIKLGGVSASACFQIMPILRTHTEFKWTDLFSPGNDHRLGTGAPLGRRPCCRGVADGAWARLPHVSGSTC